MALGNLLLRVIGLQPGDGEGLLHSNEELKLLVSASHAAGMLDKTQQEVIDRVFTLERQRVASHTLSGLIIDLLRRLPRVGDVVRWEGLSFTVQRMDGRRIDQIVVRSERKTHKTKVIVLSRDRTATVCNCC